MSFINVINICMLASIRTFKKQEELRIYGAFPKRIKSDILDIKNIIQLKEFFKNENIASTN